ncbi:MAG: hypothetical protein AB7S68_01625 [Polyangiaceae bacterium]
MQDCYSGPAGTLGAGICRVGTQTCDDNSAWGVCVGESLPQIEDCTTPTVDENCDHHECGIWGLVFDQGGGGPTLAVANDDGSLVIGGIFSGGLQIGDKTAAASDDFDAFLARIDSSGHVEWLKNFGLDADFLITGANAPDGSVYAAVANTSPVDFGDGERPAGATLLRISASGEVTASRSLGSATPLALRVSAQGRVYVAGSIDQPIDLGSGQLTPQGSDILAMNLEPDLTLGAGWIRSFGSLGLDAAYALEVDAVGNVYLGGAFENDVDFDSVTARARGAVDAFLVKLSSAGQGVATYVWGSISGNETILALGVDAVGSVTVYGRFDTSFTQDSSPVTAVGMSTFLSRVRFVNADFQLDWAKGFGSFTPAASTASRPNVGVSPNGDVAFTGDAVGAVDLGTTTLTGFPNHLPAVIKLDKQGNTISGTARLAVRRVDTRFRRQPLRPAKCLWSERLKLQA